MFFDRVFHLLLRKFYVFLSTTDLGVCVFFEKQQQKNTPTNKNDKLHPTKYNSTMHDKFKPSLWLNHEAMRKRWHQKLN